MRLTVIAAVLLAGCGDDINVFGGGGSTGNGGAPDGGAPSGAGSVGGSGGEGGSPPECTTPADCPVAADCLQPVCLGGACGTTFTPAGTPSGDERVGDCKASVCDGNGSTILEDDDDDVPDDAEECTVDACEDGVPSNEPTAADTPCGDGLVCNGLGMCTGCTVAAQCGEDTECIAFTCIDEVCGSDPAELGTPVAQQSSGDCLEAVCNGAGGVISSVEDTDVPVDGNECTGDLCVNGVGSNPNEPDGEPCANGGACDGGACIVFDCNDNTQNGQETDEDCGGPICPPCGTGMGCVLDSDCVGGSCPAGTCEASCVDGVQNGGEVDIDCGGPCDACQPGAMCTTASDCATGVCSGICGEYQLVISELRARGPGAGTDDFIEIYNPLNIDVVTPLSSAAAPLQIVSRSDAAGTYTVKHTFNGETIGAHRHFLLAGSGYTGSATPDVQAGAGLITDKVSVALRRGAFDVDAVCIYFSVDPFDATYSCEFAPFVYSNGSANIDRSFERLPGGALGNGTDTNNNTVDFVAVQPSNPQNLASPATP